MDSVIEILWTDKFPNEPGHYLLAMPYDDKFLYDIKLVSVGYTNSTQLVVNDSFGVLAFMEGGLWYGPIPEPKLTT